MIAPLPNPEPFFNANSQKVFARRYATRADAANQKPPFSDQFFAKISATNSKNIRMASGINH